MRMERVGPVDAGTLLVRALRHGAAAAGIAIHVESIAMRPWSSATFTGTQARVVLSATADDALDAWLSGVSEAELALRGHLVADLVVEDDTTVDAVRRVVLAVLTLVAG